MLAEADSLREELEKRRPPVAIIVKLGRMYEDGGRYPDAIDWYRRAIEEAEPTIERFRALRAEGVEEAAEAPAGCLPTGPTGSFEAASARAAVILADGDSSLALACHRAALTPIARALHHRAECWNVLDSPLRALEDMKLAAEILQDDPEILFLLGAIAFEMEPESLGLARAKLAREAWRRFVEIAEEHPLASHVREALPHVDSIMEQGRFGEE